MGADTDSPTARGVRRGQLLYWGWKEEAAGTWGPGCQHGGSSFVVSLLSELYACFSLLTFRHGTEKAQSSSFH